MTTRARKSVNTGKIVIFVFFFSALSVLSPIVALADSEPQDTVAQPVGKPVDQSSANFRKTKKFVPGEEVVTTTGKKVKVWSTEGPVPVSPPPQPFDDPSKNNIDGINVVVDENRLHGRPPQQIIPRDRDGSRVDSFDVRPGASPRR